MPVSPSSDARLLSGTLSQERVGQCFDRCPFEVPSAPTSRWVSIWFDSLPPQFLQTLAVPTQCPWDRIPSGHGSQHHSETAFVETIALNDGVPKCAVLLDGEVVIGTLPVFIGAGDYPHPALLAPWFTP